MLKCPELNAFYLLGVAIIMKKKILAVDDSPFMLKVIGDMLTNLSYEVTTVDSGRLACLKAEAARL